ncbi:MAG: signal peptidase II [Deltaproteobacteria bacterium CG07_land_8_20_14_0_80_38_7]|nr:MAG: signal peptidase II [Deltaproteobacteria bacterium CG07_land_8_20_14_0_80_38_7]
MSFKYKALIITPIVFILDQLTKLLVIKEIPLYNKIQIIPGYFDLVHYQNPGAAFGMFTNMPDWLRQPFFYSIAVVVSIMLLYFLFKLSAKSRLLPVAIALIFGGMAGNIMDRIRLGVVTDFLSFHIKDQILQFSVFGKFFSIQLDWPAFNVADSAITIAMFLLLISAFKPERREL